MYGYDDVLGVWRDVCRGLGGAKRGVCLEYVMITIIDKEGRCFQRHYHLFSLTEGVSNSDACVNCVAVCDLVSPTPHPHPTPLTRGFLSG